MLKVIGGERKCPAVSGRVPDQGASHFVGEVHPLVQVKGEGVGPFHALHESTEPRSKRGERAECAIDMEPDPFGLTEIRKLIQGIAGPRIHGPCTANHAERPAPLQAVFPDCPPERFEVDSKPGRDRDQPECVLPQPQELNGLLNGAVHFG